MQILFIDILRTRGFRTLLRYPDDFQFDLIIYNFTPGACLLGFLHKFNYPPLLSVTSLGNPAYLSALIGSHSYYSYIPHYNLLYKGEMNFFQRCYNFAVHLSEF